MQNYEFIFFYPIHIVVLWMSSGEKIVVLPGEDNALSPRIICNSVF